MARIYLDHNATAHLRPEAREAMIAAMDVIGNPSSVHAEGRAAKALMERARAQIGAALGAGEADIVFTSGATEAAALALKGRGLAGAGIEHDAVRSWIDERLPVDGDGRVTVDDPARSTLQLANSESGVIQDLPEGLAVSDLTQGFGKLPFSFSWSGIGMGFVSAHKIGGPRGIGALVMQRGTDPDPILRGGGQEMGWRAGTENLVAIAGFGAAAEAAMRELEVGTWDRVAKLRNILEKTIEAEAKETIFVGKASRRLPNTSCFVTPGWKGETQVMQMDMAGFAVSAGSACSSGKVRASHALRAMGFDEGSAASALRVSLGPATGEDEIARFCEAWLATYRRHRARAA
ncbi:cysteine desulfurase [Ponticoccus sp. SC2-23]|uniref:cysteine desulfurase family protein n=1 Tax=Alexandriicola marinus TaxID=2081710 RepID=UPI000FD7609E|nr:cysteine desulfurase family protein [Alexandriicola marinus]MBM1219044.1 cysteine desulfurase [Ponticoccus sp. SC6-9]MBM1223884.1 cysteine desulfurase [Ponticoccus sp. SC6-15]MBM1228858.1 cysteine desulfurase [Ponticoccus sp. SC6-38]MBM1232850.1 cysteine desulfurase [Ponticoccus sp. SC6-45]MBM1237200.1 cysteine desulfurase [Ponticoccus sp. SC6-49]MBM1241861.1 cysteine desulfurase [Ponticoccus sp. SC2-64]MBM1246374.1 cysteine desulfurase [Ponticoccus sp. SC6-42]MBM1250852.1 cysteine desul